MSGTSLNHELKLMSQLLKGSVMKGRQVYLCSIIYSETDFKMHDVSFAVRAEEQACKPDYVFIFDCFFLLLLLSGTRIGSFLSYTHWPLHQVQFLHILVGTSANFPSCCPSIISNQFAHSPPASDISGTFSSNQLLIGNFLFFMLFSGSL